MKKRSESLLPMERIAGCILVVRKQKVMLDEDLAGLYGVETGRLLEAVKRHIDRFPADFMFRLSYREVRNLISQIAISSLQPTELAEESGKRRFSGEADEYQDDTNLKSQIATSSLQLPENTEALSPGIMRLAGGHGGRRKLPYVFTEHGVAMLSSVLNSPRAVSVNIEIVRTFVRLRHFLATHEDLARKIEEHDGQLRVVFDALRQLMAPPKVKSRPIGFGR